MVAESQERTLDLSRAAQNVGIVVVHTHMKGERHPAQLTRKNVITVANLDTSRWYAEVIIDRSEVA